MSLSFILALLALVVAVVALFVPAAWTSRALAGAIVLLAVAAMLLTGGIAIK